MGEAVRLDTSGGAFTVISGETPPPLGQIDALGNIRVMWVQKDAAGLSRVYAAHLKSGAHLGTVVVDDTADVDAGNLKFHLDHATGNLVAVWHRRGHTSGLTELVASSLVSGVWTEPHVLSATPADVSASIHGTDGRTVVGWKEQDGTVMSASHDLRWSASETVYTPVDTTVKGVVAYTGYMGVGGSAVGAVGWLESDANGYALKFSAHIERTIGWTTPVTLAYRMDLDEAGRVPYNPILSSDPSGNVTVSWLDTKVGGTSRIWIYKGTPAIVDAPKRVDMVHEAANGTTFMSLTLHGAAIEPRVTWAEHSNLLTDGLLYTGNLGAAEDADWVMNQWGTGFAPSSVDATGVTTRLWVKSGATYPYRDLYAGSITE